MGGGGGKNNLKTHHMVFPGIALILELVWESFKILCNVENSSYHIVYSYYVAKTEVLLVS